MPARKTRKLRLTDEMTALHRDLYRQSCFRLKQWLADAIALFKMGDIPKETAAGSLITILCGEFCTGMLTCGMTDKEIHEVVDKVLAHVKNKDEFPAAG